MYPRFLELTTDYSLFLFGPRGTGKSTLLRSLFPPDQTLYLDLLDFEVELRIGIDPGYLKGVLDRLSPQIRYVIIDEVQKQPHILNEVHRQIEKNNHRFFILTGSSARKLKRGQANLLAGRAFSYTLYPFMASELGDQFDLGQALCFGTLPGLSQFNNDSHRIEFLKAYSKTYMVEEIQAEGLVRKLPQFSAFLSLMAIENGNTISYNKFASDIGIDTKTIRAYIEILEDTLLGFILPAYAKSIRSRQKSHPKFYLFDPGVKRALAGQLRIPLVPGSSVFGRAYEHFWILEIMRFCSYKRLDFQFSYFATADIEIDLVIERPGQTTLFIEIKSTTHVKRGDARSLSQLVTGNFAAKGLLLCREPEPRDLGEISVIPDHLIFEALLN